MIRFTRNRIVLAALLSSAAPVLRADPINYLNLTTQVGNINVQGGIVSYTSNGGAGINVTAGTSYSVPTSLGLTDATVQAANTTFDQLANSDISVSALATADLASGSVGVYALPQAIPVGQGYNSNQAIASATLNDLLTFNVAGASSSTVTDIGVTFTVDGTVSPGTSAANGGVESEYNLKLGDGTIDYVYDTGDSNPNLIPINDGWVSTAITSESPDSFVFSGVYALTGATDPLNIQMLLSLNCTGNASCDVSHTGAVSFTLPSNVTFTSASGVFLTQPVTSATPEPSYTLVAGIGFLGLVVFARRRHHSRA
jgi:hypothetical protein